MRLARFLTAVWALSSLALPAAAGEADPRAQYPSWLAHSYVDVDLGAIRYPFSAAQLEPGHRVGSIETPPFAIRVILGHRLGRYASAEISYMRPFEWVQYGDVDGVAGRHSVWMNVAGLTARGRLPIEGPLSVSGEAGLGIVTRSGFKIDGADIVTDASFATVLLGAGLHYRLNDRWELAARGTYAPEHGPAKQPHTVMVSGGLAYTLQPLSDAHVRENADLGTAFPRNVVQAGYATDAFGLGVNHFVTRTVPIFWDGLVDVRRGGSLRYEHNVFHTRRLFSLDWGVSGGYWQSAQERASFYTASVFPVLRLTPLRTGVADVHFAYSLAGPTYISKLVIDGQQTGRHFTFQDSMGVGAYWGARRALNTELRITHYSNGNLFSRNAGVTIPLTFNVGYTF